MTMEVAQIGVFYIRGRAHSAVMMVSPDDWAEYQKVLQR